MIVLGTRDDLTPLMPLFKRFQEEFSPWDDFSEEKITESFEHTVFNPSLPGLFAIAQTDEGKPGGFLIAVAVPSLFSYEIQTQELAFFVVPEERKSRMARNLLGTYQYWAKDIVNADICSLSLMDDRVGKLYERMGYIKAETSYIKKISKG